MEEGDTMKTETWKRVTTQRYEMEGVNIQGWKMKGCLHNER